MICTQSIPQFPFSHTQPPSLCPEDLNQVCSQSACCKASPKRCGTVTFQSPLAERHNLNAQPSDFWSFETVLSSSQYDQVNDMQQDHWHVDKISTTCIDNRQNIVSLDGGLGITTNQYDYAAIDIPTTNPDIVFPLDQGCLYGSQQVTETFSISPSHQSSQSPTGCDGAYFCGTAHAAEPAPKPSLSGYSTPLPLHKQPVRHSTISSTCSSDFVQDCASRDEGIFKRPTNRLSFSNSKIPQSTMYSYGTPLIQASPLTWTPQTETPDWPDNDFSRNFLQLPQVILDYSPDYDVQESTQLTSQMSTPASNHSLRTVMTVPPRRKPHLRPSLSESCVPRLSSPARMRAASMSHFLYPHQHDHTRSNTYTPQLPLPALLPSMLIHASPTQLNLSVPGTPHPYYGLARSHSSTPQRRSQPSSPPQSDFDVTNSFFSRPIRQEPTFVGDIYTPVWKRKTPNGRWEGWCGYCQPGRWLDLKNSRYWEDKYRNHGICARTKTSFADPEQIRWVNPDGTTVPAEAATLEGHNPYLDTRKREGLCGICHNWITMDGPRTRAADRPVGWWVHAYKCHSHKSKADETKSSSV